MKTIESLPDGTIVVTDPRTLAEAQAERIAAIKAAARDRILAVCPEWKQANLTARAAELGLRGVTGGPALTAAEKAEIAAGATIWAQIKAIRAASDQAEAAVLAAATNDDADAVVF